MLANEIKAKHVEERERERERERDTKKTQNCLYFARMSSSVLISFDKYSFSLVLKKLVDICFFRALSQIGQ